MRRTQDIRFEYALGGGAMMDLGCYLVSMTRFVLRCADDNVSEPEVISAGAPAQGRRRRIHAAFARSGR